MSWLDELEYDFEFVCDTCSPQYPQSVRAKTKPEDAKCESCGSLMRSIGFRPMKLNHMAVVSYDQNGRKAYRITTGDGNVTHISKTKYEYLKTLKNKSALTKEYQEHVQDQQEVQYRKFKQDLNSELKGKVSGVTMDQMKQAIKGEDV